MLYIDLHLIHEVTSPQAFSVLQLARAAGAPSGSHARHHGPLDPDRTDQVFGQVPIKVDAAAKQVRQLERNAAEFGVELFGMRDARRGIVHVISPELGATQPGMTIVCGDSHTSTHGAFGALAFGIGSTEVGHVLATQCLLQRKPKTFAINVEGKLPPGVTAKDLILAIIGKVGVSGGTGHVFEYRGSTIRALSMDERMTVCNMSIEAGARAGMIAPDETTFAYLKEQAARAQGRGLGRRASPAGRALASDAGASVRCVGRHRCGGARADDHLRHQSRAWCVPISGAIPAAPAMPVYDKALGYMGFQRRRGHVGQAGECGVHRQLHQRTARGFAGRGANPQGPQGGRRRAPAHRPRLAARSSTMPRRRASARSSRRPAPTGASRDARCASG